MGKLPIPVGNCAICNVGLIHFPYVDDSFIKMRNGKLICEYCLKEIKEIKSE